jgi:uncharacterized protein with von Willebrand factor type A (vWA) domain
MRWKKEEQIVKFDHWDKQDWDDVLFDMRQVQKNRDELWEKYNFVHHEFQDIFMSLFQGDPANHESRDIQEDHILNDHITRHFQDLTEVAELRVSTKYDPYAAAFSMITLQPKIKELYEQNQELVDLMNKIKELLEQLSQTSDPGQAGEIEGQIQELVAQAKGELGDMKIDLKSAVKNTSDALEQEDSLMKTFGLEDGQLQRMSFKERRALADHLKSGKFAQFANLLGQFKLVAKGARRSKVSTVPDEIAGLELGRDLGNLSIESLIALSVPEMELKFWSDYVNYELVQKKVVGPHSLGRGDVVFVMDESGSMGASCYGGTREMWGKALALALLGVCRRSKRTFTYLGFSGSTNFRRHTFPKGRVDPAEMIAMVEGFYGGGTYPYAALMEAARIVDAAPSGNRPDVVFLTDGEFGTPGYGDNDGNFFEEWARIKNKTHMQSFGVAFDGEPREMKNIVDTVINLEDLQASPDKMHEVFKAIQN